MAVTFRTDRPSRVPEKEEDLFQFGEGLSAGIDTTIGTGAGALAALNSFMGDEEDALEWLSVAQDRFQRASESGGTVTNFDDIQGAGDYLRWGSYALGTILPSIATSVVGGGVGGLVLQSAGKKIVQDRVKKEVYDSVQEKTEEAVKNRIYRETLDAQTKNYRRFGAGAGAIGSSVAQNTGATFVDVYEETGIESPETALAAGIASGLLDAATPLLVLSKIMPAPVFKKFKDGMTDKIVQNKGVTRRVLTSGASQFFVEGFTEATQELIQATAVGMMRENPEANVYSDYLPQFIETIESLPEDEQLQSELRNAFLVGALGGTFTGGVSGALKRDRREVEDVRQTEEEAEQEAEPDPLAAIKEEFGGNLSDRQARKILQQRQARDKAVADAFPEKPESEQQAPFSTLPEDGPDDTRLNEARERQRTVREREQGLGGEPQRAGVGVREARQQTQDLEVEESIGTRLAGEADSPNFDQILMDSLNRRRKARSIIADLIPESVYETGVATPDENAQAEAQVQPEAETQEKEVDAPVAIGDIKYNAEDDTFTTDRNKTYRYEGEATDEAGNVTGINAVDLENGESRAFTGKKVPLIQAARDQARTASITNTAITFDDLSTDLQMRVFEQRQQDGADSANEEVTSQEIEAVIQAAPESSRSSLRAETEALFSRTSETEFDIRQTFEPTDQWLTFEGDVVNANQETLEARQDRINLLNGQPTKPANGDDLIEIQGIEAIAETIADAMRRPTFFKSEIDGVEQNVEAKPAESVADESATNEIQQSIFDLVEAGLPSDFVTQVQAISVHTPAEGNKGLGATVGDRISLDSSVVTRALTEANADRELRYVLAHESWHVLDNTNGISSELPSFKAEIRFDAEGPKISLGDAIANLYDNYLQKTELGRRFTYPFNELDQKLGKTDADSLAEFVQKESFAQLGAVYLSNPKLLKEQAPEAYNVIRTIRDNPTLAIGEGDERVQDTEGGVQPEGAGVSGEVRAPAVSGSAEVEADGGSGEAGLDGADTGQADQGVAGEAQPETGDGDGPAVQQGLADDAPEQGTLFVRRLDGGLTEQEKQAEASTLLSGEESLEVEATGKNNRRTVTDVSRALDTRTLKIFGRSLADRTDDNAEIISNIMAAEAEYALSRDGNAGEWYQQKVANAMLIAEEIFPELKDNPNQQAMFKAALAITSNGSSVDENSSNTINKVFGKYIETGKFPIIGYGKESPTMKKSFKLLNVMIEEMGLDNVREFLSTDFTRRELEASGFKVNGEGIDTVVKGSAILGPKIGQGFYQNLQGNYDTLTMDLWYMRTWGRINGNLMSDSDRKFPESLRKFRDAVLANERPRLRKEGITVAEFKNNDEVAIDLAMAMNGEFSRGGYKNKTPANNAARNLKNSTKAQETPRGSVEREWMRKVTRMAVDKLNAATGEGINTAAFQALIWYPEKDLYNKLGTPNKKSEPTDYETEFAKIATERGVSEQAISRIIGLEQQSGAGGVQQDPRSDAGVEDAPSGTEAQQADAEQGLAATVKVGRPNTKVRPEVRRAYEALQSGQITRQEYDEAVLETIRPYEAVPTPATAEEMSSALRGTQVGRVNQPVDNGASVGLRLDINAYEKNDTWVPTIHDARGRPISHMATASVTGADFTDFKQSKAQKVMEGGTKTPFAQIKGAYVGRSDEENVRLAQQYLNDPEWRQVGFDPRRHSTFYDRATGEPIATAEEVIQVGPLVLAKNAEILPTEQTLFVKKFSGEKQSYEEAKLSGELKDGSVGTNEYTLDDATRTEAFLIKWQDEFLMLKKAEESLAKSMGVKELPEEMSPYPAEALHSGKIKADYDALRDDYIKPIGDLLREDNISLDEIASYLYAKHAPERNREIAKKNPEITNGSGLTDQQAADHLANTDKVEQKERIAALVYEMLEKNRQRMVDFGLIEEETIDDFRAQYDFYVPLKGFAATEEGDVKKVAPPSGLPQGFSIGGKEFMTAWGRQSKAENPLLFAMKDVADKIVRARRLEVTQKLVALADQVQAMGSDQFRVYRDPSEYPMLRNEGKLTRMNINNMRDAKHEEDPSAPRFLRSKEDGKEIFIGIKNPALNSAMHKLGSENYRHLSEMSKRAVDSLQWFQNTRRNFLINWNPSWFLINPLRDLQTGIMYALSESSKAGGLIEGENITTDILKNWLPAGRAYLKNSRGGSSNNEFDALYKEYVEAGAPTGMTLTRDIDEQKRQLENIMSEGTFSANVRKLGKLVEDLNTSSENMVRFSAFAAARGRGVSAQKAALLAKNLTVNFNRKGELNSTMNLFYLFFNAAVQGTANIAQAMTGKTADGKYNTAQMAAFGIAGVAAMVTQHNLMEAEEDDDGQSLYSDLSDYDKLMSWNIVMPDGKSFLQIPMPYGYGMFHTLGRLSVEWGNGEIDAMDVAAETTAAVAHHFLPPNLGFTGQVLNADDGVDFLQRAAVDISPDFMEPVLALGFNKTHFGSPIYIPDNPLLPERPDSARAKRNTEKIYRDAAELVNSITGGTENIKGKVDISPDVMKYAVEYWAGGVARFFNRSMDVGYKAMDDVNGNEVLLKDYPILRYFAGEPRGFQDKLEYYENIRRLDQILAEEESLGRDDLDDFRRRFGGVAKLGPLYKETQKKLRALRKKKKEIEKLQGNPTRSYEQVQKLEEQMDLLYDKFNQRYREVTR